MAQSLRYVDRKLLRTGYTTGSCAAGAAKAATMMLLGDDIPATVKLMTPRGIELTLDVIDPQVERGAGDPGPGASPDADPTLTATATPTRASCAIRKDAGDDPDITDGTLVYATVTRTPVPDPEKAEAAGSHVTIDGGVGVGRVTREGLNQPVGAAAINSVPRQMIAENVTAVATAHGYQGGISVVISIPEGERLASQTFNPNLGIVGGISVLGTSGIVDPMSEAALVRTIQTELSVIAKTGAKDLLLTLGNYGERFATETMGLTLEHDHVTCSNLIGDTLSAVIEEGMERVLLVGHIGKLVKLGIGITNTHSHNGDGRIETLTSCALAVDAPYDTLKRLAACVTTDAALVVLGEDGWFAPTLAELKDRIDFHLKHYVHEQIEVAFVCFTDRGPYAGELFRSDDAAGLETLWKE